MLERVAAIDRHIQEIRNILAELEALPHDQKRIVSILVRGAEQRAEMYNLISTLQHENSSLKSQLKEAHMKIAANGPTAVAHALDTIKRMADQEMRRLKEKDV